LILYSTFYLHLNIILCRKKGERNREREKKRKKEKGERERERDITHCSVNSE
jgi:hypothetical protein